MKPNFLPLLLSLCLLPGFARPASAATPLAYDYDANGNMIRGEGKYFEYDEANRLVKVRHKDENGPVIAEYVYDYNRQRIKKTEEGVTTYYVGKQFERVVEGESQGETSYYFVNGERVAKKDAAEALAHYHSDHLGGTIAVSGAGGNALARTRYYPFGQMRDGVRNKYSFTGKELDLVTEQYYYDARYYVAQLKVFTQADTAAQGIYDPQNMNRYAYSGNNPTNFVDPSGHEKIRAYGREWNNRENIVRYENALREQNRYSLQEASAWNDYANELAFATHIVEVPAAMGGIATSVLRGDVVGVAKNAADAILAVGKLSGFVAEDAPSSITEAPGYVVGKMDFRGAGVTSQVLTGIGKAADITNNFRGTVQSAVSFKSAIQTYGRFNNLSGSLGTFRNLNFSVPALEVMDSTIQSYDDLNAILDAMAGDSSSGR